MATYSISNRKENTTSFVLNRLQEKAYSTVNNALSATETKYDASYTKEKEATFAGVFLFVIPVLFTFFSMIDIAKNGGADTFIKVMLVGALVIRVFATKWVSSIAAEQNRSTAKWRALSFFLPAISLIIMGQTKKLSTPAAVHQQNRNAYNAKAGFKRLAAKQDLGLQMAS